MGSGRGNIYDLMGGEIREIAKNYHDNHPGVFSHAPAAFNYIIVATNSEEETQKYCCYARCPHKLHLKVPGQTLDICMNKKKIQQGCSNRKTKQGLMARIF